MIVQQQGWGMTAVDHLGLRALVEDVEYERGDEVFAGIVLGIGHLVQVPAHAHLEGRRQRRQGGVPMGALTERAQHHRRLADGGQTLAPDIADDHPGRGVGGAGDREQVAPDVGLVLGGQIQPGHAQRTDPAGWRPQQNPLRRLGHRSGPAQLPSAPLPYMADEHHQCGEHGQGDDLRDVVGRGQSAVERRDDHLGGHSQYPNQSGQRRPGERSGERGRDDQQRAQMDVGGGADVHHSDHDDQRERDRHQTAARRLLHEAVH